jgi:hypothetical protein
MTDAAPASPDVTAAGATAKAALYLRVSSGRQPESDLSIPDQRRQITNYCAAKRWDVAAEFVEPGNTATDDRRPAFQAMIDAVLAKPPTFTFIIVHYQVDHRVFERAQHPNARWRPVGHRVGASDPHAHDLYRRASVQHARQ